MSIILNDGKIETANLIEWLAVDQLKLLKLILEDLNKIDWHFGVREVAIFATKDFSINTLDKVLDFLFTWSSSKDDNICR